MPINSIMALFHVKSVAKSLDWYQDVFSAEVPIKFPEEGAPVWAHVKAGGMDLMLGSPPDGDPPAQPPGLDPHKKGTVHYVMVDDVDGYHADLKRKGYEVSDLIDQFYGSREFFIQDPDGHLFSIGQVTQQQG